MIVAYACDCMSMCVKFEDEIFFLGGENVKPGKNSIFLKNGKKVIYCYSTGGKSRNSLDLDGRNGPHQ